MLSTGGRNMDAVALFELQQKAFRARRDIIGMLHAAGSGHPGGSLSAVDILIYLYECVMRTDPERPTWEDRDRLILSKGHAAPALYAVLAQRQFFGRENLGTLRSLGGMLQGHPDSKSTPGVDVSTGSLGLGLSVGLDLSLAARLDRRGYRTFVLMGDGELDEGQVWEAAMAAAKFGTDNLTAIVDNNGVQLDGRNDAVMPLGDIEAKFAAFGWNVLPADGHDFTSLECAFAKVRAAKGVPSVILARTVKGKGVTFMEGKHEWHGGVIGDELYEKAIRQLESTVET